MIDYLENSIIMEEALKHRVFFYFDSKTCRNFSFLIIWIIIARINENGFEEFIGP